MNWFEVILDTVPPAIQVIAPTWTTATNTLPVRVETNEPLNPGVQDAALVDAAGVAHPFVLVWDGEAFYGTAQTWDAAVGVAEVQVTVEDEAGNPATATAGVMVLAQATLLVTLGAEDRTVETGLQLDRIENAVEDGRLAVEAAAHGVEVATAARNVSVEVSQP